MKQLTITGMDDVAIGTFLVDVKGDNFNFNLTVPLFLPIINVCLLDVDKKETKRIREIMRRVKALVTP